MLIGAERGWAMDSLSSSRFRPEVGLSGESAIGPSSRANTNIIADRRYQKN